MWRPARYVQSEVTVNLELTSDYCLRSGHSGADIVMVIRLLRLMTSSPGTGREMVTWRGGGWPVAVSRLWTMTMSRWPETWRYPQEEERLGAMMTSIFVE